MLSEKFPHGFPERIGGLTFVREENYSPDSRAVTAERLMSTLYNLIFYNPIDCQLFFSRDERNDITRVGYVEDEEYQVTGLLETSHVYFTSRRKIDRTFREKHEQVIGMYIEFYTPLFDFWRDTVYREPLSKAAIYVAEELKQHAEEALRNIDKLRRGEQISLI